MLMLDFVPFTIRGSLFHGLESDYKVINIAPAGERVDYTIEKAAEWISKH